MRGENHVENKNARSCGSVEEADEDIENCGNCGEKEMKQSASPQVLQMETVFVGTIGDTTNKSAPAAPQQCIPNGDGSCFIPVCYPHSPAPVPSDTPTSKAFERFRKLLAELLGTGLLVMIVVGSGIAATQLSNDGGVQLLINSVATMGGLYGLITIFGPISGAHFNPCVSLVDTMHQDMSPTQFVLYSLTQCAGGILGSCVANFCYDLPQAISTTERYDLPLWISELIATSTLILVIHGSIRTGQSDHVPTVVSLWVGGGYFFTSSSIFANPAVTVGRIFSDTFAGIDPPSAGMYVCFQLLGALLGFMLVQVFYKKPQHVKQDDVLYQRSCLLVTKEFTDKESY